MDALLSCLMSPEEQQLTALVKSHGGAGKVMRNESLFRQLVDSRVTRGSVSNLG